LYREDGRSVFPLNVGKYLADYAAPVLQQSRLEALIDVIGFTDKIGNRTNKMKYK
jgi:hypothetical protein